MIDIIDPKDPKQRREARWQMALWIDLCAEFVASTLLQYGEPVMPDNSANLGDAFELMVLRHMAEHSPHRLSTASHQRLAELRGIMA